MFQSALIAKVCLTYFDRFLHQYPFVSIRFDREGLPHLVLKLLLHAYLFQSALIAKVCLTEAATRPRVVVTVSIRFDREGLPHITIDPTNSYNILFQSALIAKVCLTLLFQVSAVSNMSFNPL